MCSLACHYSYGNSTVVLRLNRVEEAAIKFQKRLSRDEAARQAEFCFFAVKALTNATSNNGKATGLQGISPYLF